MRIAAELAGFFVAHTIWGLEEHASVDPLFVYTAEDGQRHMQRMVGEDQSIAIERGRHDLESNPHDANDAVLLYDAFLTIDGDKTSALIVEMRAYFSFWSKAAFAVPYTRSPSGELRIYPLVNVEWTECDDFDMNDIARQFLMGIHSHEEGQLVWSRSYVSRASEG